MESEMEEPRSSWFRTHLNLLLAVWIGFGLIAGIYTLTVVRTSDITKLAITTAVSNPVVLDQVGSPVKTGWLIPAKIAFRRNAGQARLSIPISGPKGSGTLFANGVREAGVWRLVTLRFRQDGSTDWVDLLASGVAQPAASPHRKRNSKA